MHSNGLCHRDIKSENILIDSDLTVKIADFGSAAQIKSLSKEAAKFETPEIFGSKEYNAPEIIQGIHYDGDKLDVYSMAVCLFVMISGNMPFRQASMEDAHFRRFCNNKSKYWSIYKKQSSIEFMDLFERMADRQESRALISEIKAHPWLQKQDAPEQLQEELMKRMSIHNDIMQSELSQMLKRNSLFPLQSSSDEEICEDLVGMREKLFVDAQKECFLINAHLPEKKQKCIEEEKESRVFSEIRK